MNATALYPDAATASLADVATWLASVGGNANSLWAARAVYVDGDNGIHDTDGCLALTAVWDITEWDPRSGNLDNFCGCLTTVTTDGNAVPRCSNKQTRMLNTLVEHLTASPELHTVDEEYLTRLSHIASAEGLDVPALQHALHSEAARRISRDGDALVLEHFRTISFDGGTDDTPHVVGDVACEITDQLARLYLGQVDNIGDTLTDPTTCTSLLRSDRVRSVLYTHATGIRSLVGAPDNADDTYYPRLLADVLDTHGAEIEQRYQHRAGIFQRARQWMSSNVCLIDCSGVGLLFCGPRHPALIYGPWSVITERGDARYVVVPAAVAVAADAVLRRRVFNNAETTSSPWAITVTGLDDTVLNTLIGFLHDGVNLNDAYLTAVALHTPPS
jgi:hypothetical protein